jgi:hypothetical protein
VGKGLIAQRTLQAGAQLAEAKRFFVFHHEATGDLAIMRDEGEERNARLDVAKAAAPYCHARVASTELSGPAGGPVETRDVTDADRAHTHGVHREDEARMMQKVSATALMLMSGGAS